jgi:hypothetical protein
MTICSLSPLLIPTKRFSSSTWLTTPYWSTLVESPDTETSIKWPLMAKLSWGKPWQSMVCWLLSVSWCKSYHPMSTFWMMVSPNTLWLMATTVSLHAVRCSLIVNLSGLAMWLGYIVCYYMSIALMSCSLVNSVMPQPTCSPDDLMRLASFCNKLHDNAAVHQDKWETFFHYRRYIMQPLFWSRTSTRQQQINWQRLLEFLVWLK